MLKIAKADGYETDQVTLYPESLIEEIVQTTIEHISSTGLLYNKTIRSRRRWTVTTCVDDTGKVNLEKLVPEDYVLVEWEDTAYEEECKLSNLRTNTLKSWGGGFHVMTFNIEERGW